MTSVQRDAVSMTDLSRRGRLRAFPRERLAADVVGVACGLLGALLVRIEDDGSRTIVRIVETEAYQRTDPASHSHRGPTPSNATMFGPPGHAYVYFTYGMHHCCNVVAGLPDQAGAVLLRGAAVLEGHDLVRLRRTTARRDADLAAGPARLTSALALDRSWDGTDLCDPQSPLRLMADDVRIEAAAVATGPRVGVRLAADRPWRSWIAGAVGVSPYRRHPRAP
jgi:DNA-3-methyladenine glycosylase